MTTRRLAGAVLTLAGTAAITACLRSVTAGMRDVIRVDGGACGTGGPYVIVHQCTSGDTRLLLIGFFGGLLSAALYAGGTAALGLSPARAGLAAFSSAFVVLGFVFIDSYLHPAAGQRGSVGFLIPGILFQVLALGALIPLLGGIKDDLWPGRRSDPFAQRKALAIVRAVIVPVGSSPAPARSSPEQEFGYRPSPSGSLIVAVPKSKLVSPLVSLGLWLITSVAGVVIGVLLLSSPLINLLN